MAPPASKTTIPISKTANSLNAAKFHVMAFTVSLEINNDKISPSTKRSFLKVLLNVRKIKKKQTNFEQYSCLHMNGTKIVICEVASDTLFVISSAFTSNDNLFRSALDEACDAFNAVMLDFG